MNTLDFLWTPAFAGVTMQDGKMVAPYSEKDEPSPNIYANLADTVFKEFMCGNWHIPERVHAPLNFR